MLNRTDQLKNYMHVHRPNRSGLFCICIMFLISSHHASAGIDFFSIANNAVIMYDAPSTKSGKLFVVSANLPVEAVVNVDGWSKVRDSSGSLAWVEQRSLSKRRFVIVIAPLADIHQTANENSEIIFQAQENVVMEWVDSDMPGWIHVRHQDGQAGYVKSSQVWGA